MTVSQQNFTQLFQRLAGIDLFGTGPPDVPWQGHPSTDAFLAALDPAASRLPLAYQAAYIEPLRQHADQAIQLLAQHFPDLRRSGRCREPAQHFP
jgi:hypothetical protein